MKVIFTEYFVSSGRYLKWVKCLFSSYFLCMFYIVVNIYLRLGRQVILGGMNNKIRIVEMQMYTVSVLFITNAFKMSCDQLL